MDNGSQFETGGLGSGPECSPVGPDANRRAVSTPIPHFSASQYRR